MRDGNSAGTGAGHAKMPRGTPVSITRQQQHRQQCQHWQLAAPAPPSTTTVHHPPPPSTTSPPSNTSVCIHSFSRVVAVCHDHDHDDLPPPSIGLQHKAYEWLLFATAHYYLPPPSNASVC